MPLWKRFVIRQTRLVVRSGGIIVIGTLSRLPLLLTHGDACV
jgi:hypothetical protein